jgi:flagellar FliL protein
MAEIDDDLELDVENKAPSSGKLKNILIFSVIGVLVIGISITATWFIVSSGDKPAENGEEMSAEADSGGDDHAKVEKEVSAEKKKEALSKATAMYLDLAPAFVVNLDSDSDVRYLQVEISVMVHSEEDIALLELHKPVIRHHLTLLFSSQDFAELRTNEGKETLQADALALIRKVMKDVTGYPIVKAVYLPSIVGQ